MSDAIGRLDELAVEIFVTRHNHILHWNDYGFYLRVGPRHGDSIILDFRHLLENKTDVCDVYDVPRGVYQGVTGLIRHENHQISAYPAVAAVITSFEPLRDAPWPILNPFMPPIYVLRAVVEETTADPPVTLLSPPVAVEPLPVLGPPNTVPPLQVSVEMLWVPEANTEFPPLPPEEPAAPAVKARVDPAVMPVRYFSKEPAPAPPELESLPPPPPVILTKQDVAPVGIVIVCEVVFLL